MGVLNSTNKDAGLLKKIKSYYPALSWVTLFVGFVLVVLHRFTPAGLQNIFAEEFAAGGARFALLSSSYFYLYPLLQVPAGFALDLWGPRRVAAASFFTMTVGTLLFASAATFGHLFWGRVITSVGAAFIWGTLLKLQGIYFSGRVFALLAGFGAVAGSLGVILAGTPFMAGVMRLGWRETIYLLAVVSFILMLSSLFFTQKPVSPSEKKPAISSQGKISLAGAAEVVKHRASWLLFLCHFGIYGSYAAFIGIWSYPFLVKEKKY